MIYIVYIWKRNYIKVVVVDLSLEKTVSKEEIPFASTLSPIAGR